MKFAREAYSLELVQEMMPLFALHQKETAAYPDIQLNPDLASYARCDAAGTLRIFTARLAGALVGYQVFFVTAHPHSKHSLQATQDIVYLEPTMRRGITGYKFLKWCSDTLLNEGCDAVYQHINALHDFGSVLRRMGYRLVDLVYGRRKETLCQPQSL